MDDLLKNLLDLAAHGSPEAPIGSTDWTHRVTLGADLVLTRAEAAAPEPLRVGGEEVERLREFADWLAVDEHGHMSGDSKRRHAADLRSVLALIDARPPSSEEVEKAAAWLEETVADYCDPDSAFRAAELLRRLALIEPSAGGGWRPIETAPKDRGPIVVAFSPEDWTTAEAVWRDGEWRAACWFTHRASNYFESREHVVKPVYWQPRPVRSTPSDAQSVRPDGGEEPNPTADSGDR